MVEINKDWLAPCGLYCGVCGILAACRENGEQIRRELSEAYGIPAEEIVCEGCLSDARFNYCRDCTIRDCAAMHGYAGCHECDNFPCDKIAGYRLPESRRAMLRAIPEWRKLGTEKWIAAEEERYICPHCNHRLFRHAKKCHSCGENI